MVFAGGCQQQRTDKAVLIDDLMVENESLRAEIAERNRALDEVNAELRDRSQELARLERDLVDASQMSNQPTPVVMGADAPYSGGSTGFEGIPNVSGRMGVGEVTASIESDILFDSGKATLKSDAKQALGQIVSVLNATYSGREVRVGGHTDSDPIRKSGYKSNYHLGFERAWAVREFLISRGLTPDRIYLASYGPDEPLGTKQQSPSSGWGVSGVI
jgi:flagellar motor protein MotB